MVLAAGELSVKVCEARDLNVPSIPGFFGILCPYVTLKLKDEEKRTRKVDNTKAPVFGDQFIFESRLDSSDQLIVQVWNDKEKDDTEMGHPLIGGITVPLGEILAGKTKNVQYTIVDDMGQPKGKIHLELTWTEKEDFLDRQFLNRWVGNRPWYLRTEDYYELAKSAYNYGKGFPIARSLSPIAEIAAESLLQKCGVPSSKPEDSASVDAEPENSEADSVSKPEHVDAAEADQEKALQVVDAKVKEMLKYVDELVDSKKDDIITGTKLRKNKAKFLAVDTTVATGEFIQDKRHNIGQNLSDKASYIKGKKDDAFATTTEQVQFVSGAIYEIIKPYAQKFPLLGKYFEEAEEMALEAAELIDAGIEVKEKLEDLGILPEDDEVTVTSENSMTSTNRPMKPRISPHAITPNRLERAGSENAVLSSPEHTPYPVPRMAQSERSASPQSNRL